MIKNVTPAREAAPTKAAEISDRALADDPARVSQDRA
jgi:hypothetical protein